MTQPSQVRRAGFTLVELLVVIAIIGVLIALLLPAVQQAREAARRMSCSNNLKNLALGIHNYHDIFGSFPPGFIDADFNPPSFSTSGGQDGGYSWQTLILPMIEQSALHSQFDFTVHVYGSTGGSHGGSVPSNHNAVSTPLDIFNCPSDIKPKTTTSQPDSSTVGYHANIATSSYAGCRGSYERNATPGSELQHHRTVCNGVLFENSEISFRDIQDGASNTLMLGEIRWRSNNVGSKNNVLYGSVASGGQARADYINGNASVDQSAGPFRHIRATRTAINARTTNADKYGRAFASYHPGGAMFAMSDASVRFLSEVINHPGYTWDANNPYGTGDQSNFGTYQRLGARNDGLVVSSN